MSPEPAEEDLRWVAQMGIDHPVRWTDSSKAGPHYYASRRRLFSVGAIVVVMYMPIFELAGAIQ